MGDPRVPIHTISTRLGSARLLAVRASPIATTTGRNPVATRREAPGALPAKLRPAKKKKKKKHLQAKKVAQRAKKARP
jgi:hypothetical protein